MLYILKEKSTIKKVTRRFDDSVIMNHKKSILVDFYGHSAVLKLHDDNINRDTGIEIPEPWQFHDQTIAADW